METRARHSTRLKLGPTWGPTAYVGGSTMYYSAIEYMHADLT